ncbi:MAG TPA: LAGLIDADG family homing endonuclease, partial [Candidatus Cryosericum sp.]|nr:LAGLIDADG family homing endonuclease [Candidatus Cryosericum sp.]
EDMDLYRALGFDPASGKHTVFAAYPTWMLLGMKRDGDPGKDVRYVIDAYRLKSGVEDLLDVLLDGNPSIPHPGFYAKYKYDVCIMEQNGFANLMTTHARMTQAKNRGIIFKPHETQRNKRDPYVGVQSMAESIKAGLWSFPYKTDEDKKLTDEIVTQFVDFSFTRSGRKRSLTDYVMAPLDVDTPLWTTSGWKTMGTVETGDVVATPSGDVSEVEALSPVKVDDVYRVVFDDNTSLRATIDHRWFVHPVSKGSEGLQPRWMTTGELMHHDFKRLMVERPRPIDSAAREYQIDPYVLGVWLGDGDSRQGTIFGHPDDTPHIRSEFEKAGVITTSQKRAMCFGTHGLRGKLNDIGVLRNKHVPEEYLLGSIDQRLALLQGLMDTDGTVMNGSGRVCFGNSNEALIYSVYLLVNSLGFRANIQEQAATAGVNPSGGMSFLRPFWRVVFTASRETLCPFRMPRKAEKVTAFCNDKRPRKFLTVRGVEHDGVANVRCITVSHPSHQFLAGLYFIPTGNSWFAELELRSLKRERKSFKHRNSPRGWTVQNRRGRASA